jgi:hypothetical protein
MRDVLGYILAIFAVLIAIGGVWAAHYYSPRRKYSRMRARERRTARDRTSIAELAGPRDEIRSPIETNVDADSKPTCTEAHGRMQVEGANVDAGGELL